MPSLREHKYEFDEVVIGLTTSSLLYSYIFNCPMLYKNESHPRFFEFIDSSVNLTSIGIPKDNKQLNFPKGKLVKAYSKKRVMEYLFLLLSLSGNIPFKNEISDIRVDEELKIIKITTKTQRIFRYKFNKIRIFDTRNLQFLTPSGITKEKHYVLDEFEVKIKNEKYYHVIPLEGDFPKNIYISSDKKKLMSHSMLTQEEMNDPEYSSFFISKQIEKELEANGINAKITYLKRHYEDKDPNEYEERDWIIFDKRTEEEIWKGKKTNIYLTWLGSFRYRMAQKMRDTLGLGR